MDQEREQLQSQATYLQSTISTLKLANQKLTDEREELKLANQKLTEE
jgi:hypothetical protein